MALLAVLVIFSAVFYQFIPGGNMNSVPQTYQPEVATSPNPTPRQTPEANTNQQGGNGRASVVGPNELAARVVSFIFSGN